MKVSARYGATSTLLAAGALGAGATLSQLANAAEQTAKKRYAVKPKFQLKFGVSGFNEKKPRYSKVGSFVLCQRSGSAYQRCHSGGVYWQQPNLWTDQLHQDVDVYSASTQNSAGGATYLNVLDYAFRSRAAQYHFFYSKKSEALLREPLRKRHNVQFLFTHCELRSIQLGLKWQDKPTVTSVDQLAGTKNRVTGTQLGRIAMELMNLNPVPIAWEETLDGLKQVLIDGAETWMGVVAYAGMAPVVSQCVDLKFFCGTEHTAMNLSVFDKLVSELQDAVMESAYLAQIYTQGMNEAGLYDIVGATNPQKPGTIFAENNVRVATPSDAELRKAEEMCSPEFNPKPWEAWREHLNKWSGGHDTYQEIYDIAREIPKDMAPVNVEPQRWWQS
jgi:TRAP-type C4-dicarboxylate transport system substrate-binding protein